MEKMVDKKEKIIETIRCLLTFELPIEETKDVAGRKSYKERIFELLYEQSLSAGEMNLWKAMLDELPDDLCRGILKNLKEDPPSMTRIMTNFLKSLAFAMEVKDPKEQEEKIDEAYQILIDYSLSPLIKKYAPIILKNETKFLKKQDKEQLWLLKKAKESLQK